MPNDVPETAPRFYVRFDGPPPHQSGRFIELETEAGRSVGPETSGAHWYLQDDGTWLLGPFGYAPAPPAEPVEAQRCEHCGLPTHDGIGCVEAHERALFPPSVEVEDEAQRWRCVECGLAFSEARPQGHERMTNAGPYQCGPVVEVEDEGARPQRGEAFDAGTSWRYTTPKGRPALAFVPASVEAAIRKEATAPIIEALAIATKELDWDNDWRTRAETAEGALRRVIALKGAKFATLDEAILIANNALTAESVTGEPNDH